MPPDNRTPSPVSSDRNGPRHFYHDDIPRSTSQGLNAPPLDGLRQSPPMDDPHDMRWRNPELPEVIEYLSHPNNSIKANAAAYLQHLCYMDDTIKSKTRALSGIPALVELLNSEIPEVHRNACGALRNLSYGRSNDENKNAIKNAGGIPALIRLLRKSPDNDIRELVTGILWNLSSSPALKRPIIDDGLTVLVTNVIVPHSGFDPALNPDAPRDVYWSTVFRNASGILRNVSSDGDYARKKLRECEGLVESIVHIVRAAIGKSDMDNKSVENCVCVLRNLSFACQEVEDTNYLKKRAQPRSQGADRGDSTGCFGQGGKKKKDASKQPLKQDAANRPRTEFARGMELLWQPTIVNVYIPLLCDCSNPETLEAAAGAVQNLAACDWQPSVDIRAAVRKEKGLPIIVELLTLENDKVVCAAATALRNLALDTRNKELIGKYAMKQLVAKLPAEGVTPKFPVSNETIAAVEATLYEVIRRNADFASSLMNEGGIERLMYITRTRGQYSPKVVKFASSILYTLWGFKELQLEYKKRGWNQSHFVTKTMAAKATSSKTPPSSAENTLNRPSMGQSGPAVTGYNDHTMPPINRGGGGHPNNVPQGYPANYANPPPQEDPRYMDDTHHMTPNHEKVNMAYEHTPNINHDRYGSQQVGYNSQDDRPYMDSRGGDPRYHDDYQGYGEEHDRSYRDYPEQPPSQQDYRQFNDSRDMRGYMDDQRRPDDIPMTRLDPAHDEPSPGYAAVSRPQHQDPEPYGAPNSMHPYGHQPELESREPLYARVDKNSKRGFDPYDDMHNQSQQRVDPYDGIHNQSQQGVVLDGGGPPGGADSWV